MNSSDKKRATPLQAAVGLLALSASAVMARELHQHTAAGMTYDSGDFTPNSPFKDYPSRFEHIDCTAKPESPDVCDDNISVKSPSLINVNTRLTIHPRTTDKLRNDAYGCSTEQYLVKDLTTLLVNNQKGKNETNYFGIYEPPENLSVKSDQSLDVVAFTANPISPGSTPDDCTLRMYQLSFPAKTGLEPGHISLCTELQRDVKALECGKTPDGSTMLTFALPLSERLNIDIASNASKEGPTTGQIAFGASIAGVAVAFTATLAAAAVYVYKNRANPQATEIGNTETREDGLELVEASKNNYKIAIHPKGDIDLAQLLDEEGVEVMMDGTFLKLEVNNTDTLNKYGFTQLQPQSVVDEAAPSTSQPQASTSSAGEGLPNSPHTDRLTASNNENRDQGRG